MRSFERRAKRGLIGFVAPFFPSRSDSQQLRRIVLVRVDDRLGNLIFLSPTLDWILGVSPETQIDLVASAAFAPIYAHDTRITHLHILDKRRQKFLFPVLFRDLFRVGQMHYDAALECSDRNAFSFNSALYARASRAFRRIGFRNDLAHHYLTEEVDAPEGRHAARDPLVLSGVLLNREPPPIEDCRLSLKLPSPSGAWGEKLASMQRGRKEGIVGLHIGGRGRKRWSVDGYVQVAHALIDRGYRPWIFRGPMEQAAGAPFRSVVERGGVLVPRAGIVEVGQAMSACDLLIAPDTGPMHLASAVCPRTLALFLDSDVVRYRPLGKADRWIDARGNDLTPGLVIETAVSMLAETGRVETK